MAATVMRAATSSWELSLGIFSCQIDLGIFAVITAINFSIGNGSGYNQIWAIGVLLWSKKMWLPIPFLDFRLLTHNIESVSLSFCVLLAATFWKYRELRIRRVEKLEQKCLAANGFPDLQEITVNLETKPKIFTEVEVKDKDATNNYDKSKKVGEGRYGIVYRGKLKVDGSNQMVAIKRLGLLGIKDTNYLVGMWPNQPHGKNIGEPRSEH
ncbi:hypothetical protein ACE6H2_013684 [Prunus campanulata]